MEVVSWGSSARLVNQWCVVVAASESSPEEMIRGQRKCRLLPARVTVYELAELLMRQRGDFVALAAHSVLDEDLLSLVGGHHNDVSATRTFHSQD